MALNNLDIGQLLINAKDAFNGAHDFIIGTPGTIGAAEFTGMCLVALSLYRAARMSNDGNQITMGQLISPVVIGGMFIAWSTTSQMVSETVGLSGGALGYTVKQGSQYSQQVIDAVLVGVSLLGTLAVFRGLLKWKAAGEGNHHGGDDPVWAGLWHIIGGGIAMNISQFLQMLGF